MVLGESLYNYSFRSPRCCVCRCHIQHDPKQEERQICMRLRLFKLPDERQLSSEVIDTPMILAKKGHYMGVTVFLFYYSV